MNSTKCKQCGLSNFAADFECRRCGNPLFGSSKQNTKERPPRIFSIISLVIFAALAVGGYYIFSGMQDSVAKVNADDANRVATQPPQQQPVGLSRTEYDRQRSNQVGNSIKNNPSFEAQRQRNEETQRIMQQASNSSQQ